MQLKDPSLFREAALIGDVWIPADPGRSIEVSNPATGLSIDLVPKQGIAPLFRFRDEADVIAQANDTEFGLASYFYAKDLARVFRVAEAL